MKLKMTDEMVEIMKLQRTGAVKAADPVHVFQKNLEEDFDMIAPHLPANVKNILDIGCGIGGIDLYLWRYYRCGLSLMDKNEVEKEIKYGYRSETSAYNKLDLTREFLKMNGVDGEVYAYEAHTGWKFPCRFDVILSLISCGFHYPVDTYLNMISDYLHPWGVVILDVRKHSGQIETLKRQFKNVHTIKDFEKHERVKCYENIVG